LHIVVRKRGKCTSGHLEGGKWTTLLKGEKRKTHWELEFAKV